MVSSVCSFGIQALNAFVVHVESDISRGIPDFDIIGLGDAAVKEARKRVWSALRNQNFEFPRGKIVINLAPASMRKCGAALDLSIALSILSASGILRADLFQNTAVIGELSLDGGLHAADGVMAMLSEGKRHGITRFIIPRENLQEALLQQNVYICAADNLREAVELLRQGEQGYFTGETVEDLLTISAEAEYMENDFSAVAGQAEAKRAMEISASGGHNILLLGAAGCGKSVLARCMPGILPPLTFEEACENTLIYSVAGKLERSKPLVMSRPFRRVHSGTTVRGLMGGGGRPIKPGEITLANNGVLFFDEVTEAHRGVLESLREPLEERRVILSRVGETGEFPAKFLFIGAGNPCKCGRLFEGDGKCQCTKSQIRTRTGKLSVPFLDRIDLHVIMRSVPYETLASQTDGETSMDIRKRVIKTREIQNQRYKEEPFSLNAEIPGSLLKKYCPLGKDAYQLIENAMENLHISMRGYEKILRVSRTIADMKGRRELCTDDIAEAIQYRSFDYFKQII